MDRGAWRATVQGLAKESDKTLRLNNNKHRHTPFDMGTTSSLSVHLSMDVYVASMSCIVDSAA